jgi:hypothetical protein
VNGHDPRRLYALIPELRAGYPGWSFAVVPGYGGRRLLAYRDGCPPGLYAVITADPGELRRELDAAAASRVTS